MDQKVRKLATKPETFPFQETIEVWKSYLGLFVVAIARKIIITALESFLVKEI